MSSRKSTPVAVGKLAPDFSLPDQTGQERKLSDYRGRWLLLYFYPKDDTPGCTKQACSIRDALPDFRKLKITVLGVSVDSIKSHQKFAKKYHLPFTLLADQVKVVVKLYQVWAKKKFMGREYLGTLRTSFLINPTGKIVKIYKLVKPEQHIQEVLENMRVLGAADR